MTESILLVWYGEQKKKFFCEHFQTILRLNVKIKSEGDIYFHIYKQCIEYITIVTME